MNSSTENTCSSTPRTVTESCTARSCWLSMNCCTRPSGSLKASIASRALISVLNVSLTKSTVSVMYSSEFDSSSATWVPTSVPIAVTNNRNTMTTPPRMTPVADPRRQPRRVSRFTPGSIASDRNMDSASSTSSPLKLLQMERTTIEARNPAQNRAMAGSTQRGSRRLRRSAGSLPESGCASSPATTSVTGPASDSRERPSASETAASNGLRGRGTPSPSRSEANREGGDERAGAPPAGLPVATGGLLLTSGIE